MRFGISNTTLILFICLNIQLSYSQDVQQTSDFKKDVVYGQDCDDTEYRNEWGTPNWKNYGKWISECDSIRTVNLDREFAERDRIKKLEKAKEDYISRYHVAFNNIDPFQISTGFNMQKYEPGQAYYAYHCERAGMRHSNRILVWMIYLNNVYDGGETEFFYYHHYEPARKGTLLIWPTDWTHLHRGILSNTENKYILTGWYTFLTAEEKENEKD